LANKENEVQVVIKTVSTNTISLEHEFIRACSQLTHKFNTISALQWQALKQLKFDIFLKKPANNIQLKILMEHFHGTQNGKMRKPPALKFELTVLTQSSLYAELAPFALWPLYSQ
jgi:hypothetical protein